MKKPGRIKWKNKKNLFECVTRSTILSMEKELSNAEFIEFILEAVVLCKCIDPVVIKNVASLIKHLKSTITPAMISKMRFDAAARQKSFKRHILDADVDVRDTSGILFIGMLDIDIERGFDYWLNTSAQLIEHNITEGVVYEIGDRVSIISPLLISSLLTENGGAYDINRNIDPNLYFNMIVAHQDENSTEETEHLNVYLNEKEGLVKVLKKHVILKL
jgi:hypothetical protein